MKQFKHAKHSPNFEFNKSPNRIFEEQQQKIITPEELLHKYDKDLFIKVKQLNQLMTMRNQLAKAIEKNAQ